MRFIPNVFCLALLAGSVASGQDLPAFEVATVKLTPPNQPREPGKSPVHFKVDLDHVDIASYALPVLFEYAYSVKAYQLKGPAWMDVSMKVDIQAKPPAGATREQLPFNDAATSSGAIRVIRASGNDRA